MTKSHNELNFFDGFTSENDIFGRFSFYHSLLKVISNSPEKNLVISLDDQWGQGKTSFVKMMYGQIEKDHADKFNIVYFDAYANDYHTDPFIPISAEFYSIFSNSESKLIKYRKSFLDAAKRVGAATLISTLKAVITTSTASLINGDKVIDTAVEAAKNGSNDLTDSLEAYIEKKITTAENEKADIENFKKILTKIHQDSDKRTIFIIDELDRAKPDFSLDLLEKIKHLFSVEGVIFILVMNRNQFENSITKRYGGIDSKNYLNKFISYFVTLPKAKSSDLNLGVRRRASSATIYKYIESIPQAGRLFDFASNIHTALSLLLEINYCSLREAERCISLLYIFNKNGEKFYFADEYEFTLVLMVFLKVFDARLYEEFLDRKVGAQNMIKKLNLDRDLSTNSNSSIAHDGLVSMIEFYHLKQEEKDANETVMTQKFPNIYRHKGDKNNPFVDFKSAFDTFSIE